MTETIYALSSGAGKAGVAVIRVSGSRAGAALEALSRRPVPPPRRATRVRLAEPGSSEALDHGLALWFPEPASYTGEDVTELHVHGGRAVIDGVIAALGKVNGLRLAEPGEFTRRAFEHGKLDLTAAEGVADLVGAETHSQRRQALRQMDGALGRLYEEWRTRLVRALAHLEAELEFPDEDLPGAVTPAILPDVEAVAADIRRHLDDRHKGERLRDGLAIAILGAPNAGKSSLLNRLARRDAAIVSATAGTTRDVIEVHLDLGGYPAVVADTAGLGAARDEIEAEGVRRARLRARQADLKLAVFDATLWPETDSATAALVDGDALVVLSKCDLARPEGAPIVGDRPAHLVSSVTGEGIGVLMDAMAAEVSARLALGEAPALTRARHREALEACVAALERVRAAPLPELAAENVRLAVRALGRITGRVDVEDILDVVFREFCIGK
ncbi:MAG: tRNA uridine-5-carboxymethylaminomethyl(34) synthesis GTPase MnmE [Alphaproteobacteria bacterium]